jgi:predicted O-methyltransferase YrrM
VSATWEKSLAPYKGKPNVRYLEIGLFEGRSALWQLENILTHPTAHLTGIDLFRDPRYSRYSNYKEVFYSNLKASGFEGKAEIVEGFSQVELRKLPLESFDIIYVDGSHASRDVLEDAILSWRLLKDGGILIFDDYNLHNGMKRTLDTFFSFFADDFEPVHVDWQVILRKKAKDRSTPGPWR